MIFEVENVLLHALWAKRNAGGGTPAKYPSMGDRSNVVPRSFAKKSAKTLLTRTCFCGKLIVVKKAATGSRPSAHLVGL